MSQSAATKPPPDDQEENMIVVPGVYEGFSARIASGIGFASLNDDARAWPDD
jgi:hypothetical protein